jgi:hypothetical protein
MAAPYDGTEKFGLVKKKKIRKCGLRLNEKDASDASVIQSNTNKFLKYLHSLDRDLAYRQLTFLEAGIKNKFGKRGK